MEQSSSIINFILHSNIINFTIMLCILYFIVKKFNLGKTFKDAIEAVSTSIKKSDEAKSNSKKILNDAKKSIANLDIEIKEIKESSTHKLDAFKEKINQTTQQTVFDIEKNIERIIKIEEKKISNNITQETAQSSIDFATQSIQELLENNPELHNQFIQNSLQELDRIEL